MTKIIKITATNFVVIGLGYIGVMASGVWLYFDVNNSQAYYMREIDEMSRIEIDQTFRELDHVEILGGRLQGIFPSCLEYSRDECIEGFPVLIVSSNSYMDITCFVSRESELQELKPGDAAPFVSLFIEAKFDELLSYPCWFEGSSMYQ